MWQKSHEPLPVRQTVEKTKILAANHIFVVGSILMLHMRNVFCILSESYSLSVFDTGDYCSILCNHILLLLTHHRYEIFGDNTFRISASPGTLPLDHYPCSGILLTYFASFLLPQFFCGKLLRYADISGHYETEVLPPDVPDGLYQRFQKRELFSFD